jgi:hypothetical protein
LLTYLMRRVDRTILLPVAAHFCRLVIELLQLCR